MRVSPIRGPSSRGRMALGGLLATPVLLLAGCTDGPTALDPELVASELGVAAARGGRVLQVVTSTVGAAGGSFTLRVGADARPIAPNAEVTIPRIHAPSIEVELRDLAPGCQVAGENPRQVAFTRPGVTRTTFEVACGAVLPPAEAVIGSSGGVVGTELPGGGTARLTLLEGALAAGTTIRITALPPGDGERVRLRLEPAGLMLEVPATLVVDLSGSAGPEDRVSVRWLGRNNPIPTRSVGGTVSADLPFLGMPASGPAAVAGFGGGAGNRWAPTVLHSEEGQPEEDAGVVAIGPEEQLRAAQVLALNLEAADASIVQDVRARVLAALMVVVVSEGASGFQEAVATVCAAVNEAIHALESGPIGQPGELISPLGRRALTWEGVFQEASVDESFPCRSGDFLTRVTQAIEARFTALIDQVASDLDGEDRSLVELLFSDLPRVMELRAMIQSVGIAGEAEALVDPVITRLFHRGVVAARILCTERLGYDAFELLVGAGEQASFPEGVDARMFREIQLCGTELSWEVVGEAGELRGRGSASPADAEGANVPLRDIVARYGDRLVLEGRLDVLRCSETRTQARDERLVFRVTSGAPTQDFLALTPDGPGVNARFIPQEGLEIPLNDVAAGAPGESGTGKELTVRVFRESDGCGGALVSGLGPEFGFVRAGLTFLPLEIQPEHPASGEVDEPYTEQLSLENGQATSTWELVDQGLPPGLGLSEDGVISGIPSELGSFTFEVRATSGGVSVSRQLTIQIAPALRITTTSLPNGVVGTPYEAFLEAGEGPEGPRNWSIPTGSLPSGLSLQSLADGRGRISGTPTEEGGSIFTVRVSAGGETDEREFGIAISGQAPPPSRTLQIVSPFTSGRPVNPVRYRTRLVSQHPDMTVEWDFGASSDGRGFIPPGSLTSFLVFGAEEPVQVDPFTRDWFAELTYPDGWRSTTGITIRVTACFFVNGQPLLTNGVPTCLTRTVSW